MKAPIRISDELALPLDVVTSTLVVYGSKGMGKTVFGATLAEELAARGLRWSWLDPLGVAWGIRHSADGAGKGVECLILGGVHGDIPIEPTGGAAVADVVVEENVNVLIDFSRKPSGEMWGVGEKIRFVDAYTRRLFQRQGDLVGGRRREPLLQILDEAARYIPQTIPHGNPDLAKCVAAWQQLVEEGRNVGLGVCLLTQRSARISKDVAELADAMVAFRTIGPNSLGAVLDWLGEHVEKSRIKALSEQVRELPRGSALVVSPGWLKVERVVPIRMRSTFDSSATPKPGERPRTARGEGAKPDLEKIRERMRATIERAKAEDPKELQREIATLKRRCAELERAPAPVQVDPATLEKAYEEGKEDGWQDGLETVHEYLEGVRQQVEQVIETALKDFDPQPPRGRPWDRKPDVGMSTTTGHGRPTAPVDRNARSSGSVARAPKATPPVAPARRAREAGAAGCTLPRGDRTVLIAIAQHADGCDGPQLSVLTGYKRRSRDTYLQRLGAAGYVEKRSGRSFATDAGIAALGSDYEPLPTGAALRAYWLERLGEGERNCLQVTLDAYPAAVERTEIDQITGYARRSRDTYLQRLAARKLVDTAGQGQVRASYALFLEER